MSIFFFIVGLILFSVLFNELERLINLIFIVFKELLYTGIQINKFSCFSFNFMNFFKFIVILKILPIKGLFIQIYFLKVSFPFIFIFILFVILVLRFFIVNILV